MALIAGMMVSCDPITESDPGISANLTEADLQARVALTQTTAGQNKFTFSTNPTLTVDVPSIYEGLFGPEYNSVTWVWDTDASNGLWGNGAYMESTGPEWWQVQATDIDQQCTEKGYAKDGLEGWMTFTLAGKKVETSRGQSGTIAWDLSAVAKEGWDQGTLTFTGTIPLLGLVKMGDTDDTFAPQYEYHILEADGEHLKLAAPKPGAGDWGEAWFWNFKTRK